MSLPESSAICTRWMGGMETSAEAAVLAPVIRRLAPQDEGELRRVLLRLEPSARCSRFGQAASDAYLAKHAKCALANADSIMGAFIGDRLRGFAEIYNGRPHGFADTAFVVEPEWRRRGLGWALLRAAMQAAAESQTNTLRMIFSRHNWPMRKLANKACGKLDIILGEISVDVDLGENERSSWMNATPIKIGVV
jgi:ribosomal protein S18 acetylase RimI-like enzyme